MNAYLISSPEYYSDVKESFECILERQILQHRPEYVLYRDKQSHNYTSMADSFMKICAKFPKLKAIIHQNVALAKKLRAYGVQIQYAQKNEIQLAKALGLKVIVSTHTHEEVLEVCSLGVDYVSYSPIFATPNKGKPKGVEDLKELLLKTQVNIFALGGIVNEQHKEEISQTGVYGFASIRYFY